VKTFSIGFHEEGFDEARHARRVAAHLGTDHTELYITAREAMDVIPVLPEIYDEPFSDSSQIPTFLVSQLAKEHVTVSLSGDGGDELFGGYNRYLAAGDTWRQASSLPRPLRASLGRGLTSVDAKTWSFVFELVKPLLPRRHRYENFGDKVHKAAGILSLQGQDEIYRQLVSHWHDPASVVFGGSEPLTTLTSPPDGLSFGNGIERMMALDAISYLPDDILVKVDRAAMAVSLESRVPMLDHRVVEFAWSLPFDMKIRGNDTKWLLKQVLYRYVPQEIMDRPKMGFGVPIGDWLRGPLRGWAEDLLNPTRLREDGFFDASLVLEKWKQHLSGSHNWQYLLWDVLMFQSWLREQ
jgi:asparagine synthase (glutamine-hydrolysing)